MARDFTLTLYRELLQNLQLSGYSFQTFEEYLVSPVDRFIVLRHDVDRNLLFALRMAFLEHEMGIKASYHFRVSEKKDNGKYISEIERLNHEIGYHYEDLSAVSAGERVLSEKIYERAIYRFSQNLEYLRTFYPVKIISMHGSPLSAIDSRDIWKYYDYRDSGVICEPYFDIDHSSVLYLTDTGRRWDGEKVNVRDKGYLINGEAGADMDYNNWKVKPLPGSFMNMTEKAVTFQNQFSLGSTHDLNRALKAARLPGRIILNAHPQRWSDDFLPWVTELFWQRFKNVTKYILIKMRE